MFLMRPIQAPQASRLLLENLEILYFQSLKRCLNKCFKTQNTSSVWQVIVSRPRFDVRQTVGKCNCGQLLLTYKQIPPLHFAPQNTVFCGVLCEGSSAICSRSAEMVFGQCLNQHPGKLSKQLTSGLPTMCMDNNSMTTRWNFYSEIVRTKRLLCLIHIHLVISAHF